MLILVVNAGSSSLKLRLLDDDHVVREADLPAGTDGFDEPTVRDLLAHWPTPDVVTHRIVHGGTVLREAVRIDADVVAQLRELTALAPLHQPKSLAGLDLIAAVLPDVPAVACFDTAFHSTLLPEAYTYAVPAEWRERHGVRRYGFHGLSHAYAARRGAELAGLALTDARIVTCHLGAGASLCAVVGGRSVDTTMGFTPLEGLVMATRSGSVDPGLVLWLEEHEQLDPHEVATALEERSGLKALAGTADMREVVERATNGDHEARAALDGYAHSARKHLAAMAAAARGVDLVVFTGGVGERSAAVRAEVCGPLGWLGIALDAASNTAATGDAVIGAAGSPVGVVVVSAREDLQMAAETRALLNR